MDPICFFTGVVCLKPRDRLPRYGNLFSGIDFFHLHFDPSFNWGLQVSG